MPTSRRKNYLWYSFAILVFGLSVSVSAQTRPLFQDIQVVRSETKPLPASTPFIKKTSSVDIVQPAAISFSPINTTIPVLENYAIPGYSGILVETLDGEKVVESGSNLTYNPASNVKIATTYAAIKTFGPDYRFATSVWTDGSWESETGTIHGNLYVSGRDPVFGFEHAVALAQELNRMGIRTIQGDLVVTDNFAMNYTTSATTSGKVLFATFDAAKRSAAATRTWQNFLVNSGKLSQTTTAAVPSVTFTGSVQVSSMPSNAKLIFSHESAPMREIVKAMMCFSNNFLAERLGDLVGGPFAVSRIVQQNTGAQPAEFYLATSSGLGINRVTPAAMMKLLRVLRNDLARYRMSFTDIMPVAGVDKGTLEGRFDSDFSEGSVVGKTGTLGNTDGGVSALAGEMNTRGGRLLFVIFNQRGSVSRFRAFQNLYVSTIQGQFGGASPISYSPISLDYRLSKTKFSYPTGSSVGTE
ncbi:MAG TPA: D-alanyl-D-alanine carboxypeptidase [Pyrinomonadaceae bacterium]|nr:D-alanyl-D-alanine carboxypeptidase [Pyrinomonadaceae bacterium]